jgi:hypothetical protein
MFSYGPAYLNENSIDMGYYNIDHQLYEMHAYLITKSNIAFVQDRIRNTKWDVFDLWVSSALQDQKLAVLKTPYAMQAQGFSLLDQKESKENWHGQKKI